MVVTKAKFTEDVMLYTNKLLRMFVSSCGCVLRDEGQQGGGNHSVVAGREKLSAVTRRGKFSVVVRKGNLSVVVGRRGRL